MKPIFENIFIALATIGIIDFSTQLISNGNIKPVYMFLDFIFGVQ